MEVFAASIVLAKGIFSEIQQVPDENIEIVMMIIPAYDQFQATAAALDLSQETYSESDGWTYRKVKVERLLSLLAKTEAPVDVN